MITASMHGALAWLTSTKLGPFSMADIAGFVSGAASVWLTVEEHIANWPVGLVNNAFFFILFLDLHLYADTGLQVVYFVLGVLGWYWWLHGGEHRTELRVRRVHRADVVGCTIAAIVGLVALVLVLRAVDGAAPLADAATTVGSLVAQYLLTRKIVENWWVWIAVDVVYVPLYFVRHAPLTAVLYVLFLLMSVQGLRAWRATHRALVEPPAHPGAVVEVAP